jgi:hypothetical protein
VASQSFIEKLQTMAAVEVALKSPLIPLFKKGIFLRRILTPLWKRGEGEIGRNEAKLFGKILR